MTGETDLTHLLAAMRPVLNPGEYVFCTTTNAGAIPPGLVLGSFREPEGLTLIVAREVADSFGLPYGHRMAWLTLAVHRRAWEHLEAAAPGPTDMAAVREDIELVALVGELAAIRQRDFSAISGDELSHLVNELALRVYRQALDRQMVERRERVKAAPEDDAALDALLDLRRTLVEVDERFTELNDTMPVERS